MGHQGFRALGAIVKGALVQKSLPIRVHDVTYKQVAITSQVGHQLDIIIVFDVLCTF